MLYTSTQLIESVENYLDGLSEEEVRELAADLLCDHYNNPKNRADKDAFMEVNYYG